MLDNCFIFFSGRNFIRSKEFQEAQAMGLNPDLAAEQPISTKEKQRSIRHKLVSLTLKRKNKMGDEIKKKLQEEEYTADSYNSWLESRYVLTHILFQEPKILIYFAL